MQKERYNERELAGGLIRFEGRHPWGIGVTATVIASQGEAAVYDTLFFPSEGRRMARSLRERGLQVKIVVNSHWHIDHIGGNQFFRGRILAHRLCPRLMISNLPEDSKWARETWPTRFRDFVPTMPNETFARRATIRVGKETLLAVRTPGHTPDSIALLVRGGRAVLTGDAATELPVIGAGDSLQYLRSLGAILRLAADFVVQGHGRVVPRAKLKLDIDYLQKCRVAVRQARRAGVTVAAVSKLPLAQFVGTKRVQGLAPKWHEVHAQNLTRISEELGVSRAPK